MLNPLDAGANLQQRVLDALLKVKLANVLNADEMHALAYAAGVQIPTAHETRLHRLQRMANEASQAALRG